MQICIWSSLSHHSLLHAANVERQANNFLEHLGRSYSSGTAEETA